MAMSSNSHTPTTDFLLIIALKEEFKYFQTALNVTLTPEMIDGRQSYRFRLPAPQGQLAEGVVAFIGDMGAEEAAVITFQLLSATGAGLVANIGISGIVSDDLRLGDVVVATEADNYLSKAKIVQRGSREPLTFENIRFGGKSLPTSVSLYEMVDNLEIVDHRSWEGWLNEASREKKSVLSSQDIEYLQNERLIGQTVKIAVGPVATGPWVGGASKFKQFLKSERNRNFLAMDMESAGALQGARRVPFGVQTLVVRGISDPADERKEKLDSIRGGILREWAMGNAIRLFALLIKKIDVSAYSRRTPTMISGESSATTKDLVAESLHQNILREYLISPYNNNIDSFQAYSDLFERLCTLTQPTTTKNLFETIASAVLTSSNLVPVRIEGPPGTGKSSFLSILYWYFVDSGLRAEKAEANPLPILINLHRYNDIAAGDSGSPIERQVLDALRDHLEPLRQLTQESNERSLIVIIDGDDEYARFREQVLDYLADLLKTCKHWRIVGSRDTADSITPHRAMAEPDVSVVFQQVPINDASLNSLVDKFLVVASSARDSTIADDLKHRIQQLKLKNIDLFTLSLLLKQQKSTAEQTLAGMFEVYCERYLGQRGVPGAKSALLDRSASLAFDYQIKELRNPKMRPDERALWDLIHKHSRIADYLVARHIITGLVKNASGNAKTANTLRYLYPYRINMLCKEILNKDQNTQLQVVKAAGKILQREGVHHNAMAQAVYLAGRVEDWQARDIAKQTLQRFRDSLRKKDAVSEVTKNYLLLTRTLSISLTELGDEDAQQDYIEGLLSDPRLDMFNRGFHLEYYGDQKYSPSEPLRSDDSLGSATRTFEQLFKELSNENNPIFEIALYTLCSLAQHRHAKGTLDQTDRDRLGDAIDTILATRRIKSATLKIYLTMVRKHLKFDTFYVSRIFEDFYKIKRVPRSGWVKRRIEPSESVADHSYGAYLLALFLLPDSWTDPGYDKQKIMKMVLIHDLAEAVTGDVLPEESNDESKQREREVYEEIGVLGTYEGLGRLRDVAELWREFEARTTLNAQVAKDIDKLENLIQLWTYHTDGHRIQDFDKWNRDLLDSVNTGPGIQVLEKLLKSHQDKTGVKYTKKSLS